MKECATEDCVLSIIGNKIDLCDNDDSRPVKYKDGAHLADVIFLLHLGRIISMLDHYVNQVQDLNTKWVDPNIFIFSLDFICQININGRK